MVVLACVGWKLLLLDYSLSLFFVTQHFDDSMLRRWVKENVSQYKRIINDYHFLRNYYSTTLAHEVIFGTICKNFFNQCYKYFLERLNNFIKDYLFFTCNVFCVLTKTVFSRSYKNSFRLQRDMMQFWMNETIPYLKYAATAAMKFQKRAKCW